MASSRTVIKREDTVFESIETQSELLHYLINCFKQGKISEIEIPIENSIMSSQWAEVERTAISPDCITIATLTKYFLHISLCDCITETIIYCINIF